MPPCRLLAVADGGGRGIDMRPGLGEGRQRGGHHHGGGIVDADGGGGNRDAHALQHVGQALRREHGLPAVARAGQSDHQAVADQLVLANAFDRRPDLSARAGRSGAAAEQQREEKQCEMFHDQNGSRPSSRR